jgi:hypothetical protein
LASGAKEKAGLLYDKVLLCLPLGSKDILQSIADHKGISVGALCRAYVLQGVENDEKPLI